MQVASSPVHVAERVLDASHLANEALIAFSQRAGAPFPLWTHYDRGAYRVGLDEGELKARCQESLQRDIQAMAGIVLDVFNVRVLGGLASDAEAAQLVQVVFSTERTP